MQELLKKKTFWAGAIAIVTATGAYFTGEISLADMVQTVVIGLVGIFLRHGMITTAGGGK
jgi:hypothetical protein